MPYANHRAHHSSVQAQIESWRAAFGSAEACAAELLCDRHDPSAVAFTFVEPDLSARDLTYGELADASRRLATLLALSGVAAGDSVAVLMGKRRELVVTLLAIWRLGAVHVPLFTAFATPAIEMRVRASGARLVVTEPSQQDKLAPLDDLTTLVAGPELDELVAGCEPMGDAVAVGGESPLIHLFTSGTTGAPKAVPVPVKALASFACYMHYGLDVIAEDVFWNAADPGWAYGLYYGILGPLATGRRNLLLNAGFTAESTLAVFKAFGVTNFAAAPTVYRGLRRSGEVDGLSLRRASSAGEPLTPDITAWAPGALGVEVRDHYGQTEHGMVIVNAWHPDLAEPVRPGSMGKPLPGFTASVLDGKVVLDVTASPLMWFTGYADAPDRTAERFTPDGRWYLTGDAGSVDDDGYFFFSSRDDDLILMAGYRIAPFDVESVLATHPAVAEVAVTGRPDELRGEVVEAFVVLADGVAGSPELAAELQQLVRTGYSAHAYPRRVHFVEALPKTPSGKIQRYLLRQAGVPGRP
ncbi:acetyl-CoA synthetase [Thermocatellispora tengchongensis]|uniref:Acetyl-CoA synthetase n=1 Tax=Thermocatellispora tengchongensis TaxID=1073253 RepID=A0A840PLM2_9ACTN|nr:AMP-binding protein [Thermocatellispora tengchongensis]MBB5136945.1 acetyl-CoA synthetase [Thermocatellispora tengchongensis]